jgi:hypothetical protein
MTGPHEVETLFAIPLQRTPTSFEGLTYALSVHVLIVVGLCVYS